AALGHLARERGPRERGHARLGKALPHQLAHPDVAHGIEALGRRDDDRLATGRHARQRGGEELRRSEERRVGKEWRAWVGTAEDGIRDATVTGVQTCALPICCPGPPRARTWAPRARPRASGESAPAPARSSGRGARDRSPWSARR